MERIKIEDLKPADGATKKTVRVGRGRSSGCGKTSSRGNNGEGQRSGRTSKRGFEGGQMPSYRRLPKLKGFQLINKLEYAEINVGRLADLKMKEVTLESLVKAGKASSKCAGLRVLGNGEIKKAITVKAAYFTPSAKEKIEAAGGKAEIV